MWEQSIFINITAGSVGLEVVYNTDITLTIGIDSNDDVYLD